MMKKSLLTIFLLISFVNATNSDDLVNLLQDLAIQTACLGMYSSTEAGIIDYITNRYIDPPDWYTPPLMASRFVQMSGNMTRIETFYGVCFDYAQFAWNDIKSYQSMYNKAGMKDQQWYIAVTFTGDPNTIILYDPVSLERATRILNGVPVREYTRYKVRAHDNATGHAWLWVQHNNGTWYWIDPTWTDNTGYPWWGIVDNAREVQYYPYPEYSIASNYPRPPRPNETQSERETRSPNSTYISYTGNPTYGTGSYDPSKSNYLLIGYNLANNKPFGLTIADSMFFKKSLIYISANFGFSIDLKSAEIEWVYGVAFSINNWLRMPIGIGGNHYWIKNEGDKYGEKIYNGYGSYYSNAIEEWKHAFVIEVGLQPVIKNRYYISATYRLKGFSRSGFTIGAGIIF
jgi:hypothetical protein